MGEDSLIQPRGGKLIQMTLSGEERREALDRLHSMVAEILVDHMKDK
jgi:phosphoribosylformylglycinamidine (FGAM) synthase PurS component